MVRDLKYKGDTISPIPFSGLSIYFGETDVHFASDLWYSECISQAWVIVVGIGMGGFGFILIHYVKKTAKNAVK